MEHTPNVNVGLIVHIEHEIGIALQRPELQAGKIEIMGIPTRPAGRVTGDMPVGALKSVNEAQRDGFTGIGEIMINSLLDIPIGLPTWDETWYDRLGDHGAFRF